MSEADQLVQRYIAQVIDVKDLSDKQLDDAIAYLEQRPVLNVKRRSARATQEMGA